MKKNSFIKVALLLCTFGITLTTACAPAHEVPTKRVQSSNELSVRKTAIDRQTLDQTDDNWTVVNGDGEIINQRNPFRGFSDTFLAESLMRQQAQEEQNANIQLPEQMYPTREYRVVGVITGTADSKVYVIDPNGNRFILRRGSLIGNNNGSISTIRRDGIEVYERIADKGQYIELPLYDDSVSDKKSKIQLSLH